MTVFKAGDKVVLVDPNHDLEYHRENLAFKGAVLTVSDKVPLVSNNLHFVGFNGGIEDVLLTYGVRHATQEEIEAGHPIY